MMVATALRMVIGTCGFCNKYGSNGDQNIGDDKIDTEDGDRNGDTQQR